MTTPRRPPGPAPATPDMESVFRDRERFLSRFMWQIVLEPPLAMQRQRGAGGDDGAQRGPGKANPKVQE